MSGTRLFEIPAWECYQLLREQTIARLCVHSAGYPLAFPISYRVVDPQASKSPLVLLRTRPGGVISQALGPAALQLDDIDPVQGRAWSVLVRGTLAPVHDLAGLPAPTPWLHDGRHEWLSLEPQSISGRRFVAVGDTSFAVDWEYASD